MAERPAPDDLPGDGEDPDQGAGSQSAGERTLPAPLAVEGEGQHEPPPAQPTLPGRWVLLRDAAAFQIKLVIDGLRDVALSPLSLIAAIAGLALGRHEWFYDLLNLGRRSERWIDLFSAAKRVEDAAGAQPPPAATSAERPRRRRRPPPRPAREHAPEDARKGPSLPEQPRTWYSDTRWKTPAGGEQEGESIDDLIQALESRLQEQYRRGGVTARAKHTIDRMLDAVEQRYREGRRSPPPDR